MTAGPTPVTIASVSWLVVLSGLAWRWRPNRQPRLVVPPEVAGRDHARRAMNLFRTPGQFLRNAAGRPSDPVADTQLSLCLVLSAIAVPVVGRSALLVLVIVVAASASVRRRAGQRSTAITTRELLDSTALLALCVEAGFNVRQSLTQVAPWLAGPVGAAFRLALHRSESGGVLAEELEAAMAPLASAGRGLTAALVGAERHGAPLGLALSALGGELRAARRRAVEETARRVPIRLLFPLIFGTLPAFGLLTIAPMVAGSLDLLRGGP